MKTKKRMNKKRMNREGMKTKKEIKEPALEEILQRAPQNSFEKALFFYDGTLIKLSAEIEKLAPEEITAKEKNTKNAKMFLWTWTIGALNALDCEVEKIKTRGIISNMLKKLSFLEQKERLIASVEALSILLPKYRENLKRYRNEVLPQEKMTLQRVKNTLNTIHYSIEILNQIYPDSDLNKIAKTTLKELKRKTEGLLG